MSTGRFDNDALERSWRSIILFGQNVASYKFALAKSLIEASNQGKTFISLEDLAQPFSHAICEHLELADKQSTSSSSRFLEKCRAFNRSEITQDQLISETVARGFVNVIDAFHVVNQGKIEAEFFIDERRSKKGINLTDSVHLLRDSFQWRNLNQEVESRWRLVETAWDLGIARNLISIEADDVQDRLLAVGMNSRVDVTSSRDALNGYQKGKCFYCFDDISIRSGDTKLGDVDHFLPWTLQSNDLMNGLNGVWNLVLACQECNRGENGKFALIPSTLLLARLEKRNNYLIASHHPLRETLVRQTGLTVRTRQEFLKTRHRDALSFLHHEWEPIPKGPAAF